MAKKWRCTVCGYIHEGPEAPDQCPMCKVGKEKFVEVMEQEGNLEFVTEHVIGDGKGASKELWEGLQTNLYKRMNAESGACEDKMRLARMAKEQNLDAVHDTVHEMAKDEARHGKGFEGLYKRYFGK